MNVFILDEDPWKAAAGHADIHMNRMIYEYAELLCCIAHEHGRQFEGMYGFNRSAPKNPSYVWMRESAANRAWVSTCMIGLQIQRQFNQNPIVLHKSLSIGLTALNKIDAVEDAVDYDKHTPFVQTMAERHKGPDAVAAYRRFYNAKQQRMPLVWKGRETPSWFVQGAI